MSAWDGYVSSALLGVEAVRACSRHRSTYAEQARAWLHDVALLPLEDAILDTATSLGPPSLRSLDAIRLAGALLIEQNDEWLISRRYLSEESLALVLEDQGDGERKEVPQLQTA